MARPPPRLFGSDGLPSAAVRLRTRWIEGIKRSWSDDGNVHNDTERSVCRSSETRGERAPPRPRRAEYRSSMREEELSQEEIMPGCVPFNSWNSLAISHRAWKEVSSTTSSHGGLQEIMTTKGVVCTKPGKSCSITRAASSKAEPLSGVASKFNRSKIVGAKGNEIRAVSTHTPSTKCLALKRRRTNGCISSSRAARSDVGPQLPYALRGGAPPAAASAPWKSMLPLQAARASFERARTRPESARQK
mmetsp:Transcript_66347/g.190738  ORF Transcript_66347/g.190738 Transcript_66347/m.190738 type:complete len:247 (-) Transcript_66347:21-761(-)